MSHPFEYMVLVNYFPATKLGGDYNFENERPRKALATALGNYTAQIPDMIDKLPNNEGWVINSHSVTFKGGVAVVSILLQRSRK